MRYFWYLISLCIIVYLGFVAYVFYFDKSRNDLPLLTEFSGEGLKVQKILNERGCSYCHLSGTKLPFYASLPIAKQLMTTDVADGTSYFYLTEVEKSLKNNTPAPQADLAKIEAVMLDQSMPPMLYKTMHWSGFISQSERDEVLDWIKSQRLAYYASDNAAPAMKTEPIQPLPKEVPYNVDKALLGEKLFFDKRLSGNNTVSCSTCHDLNKGGVDGLQTSTGIDNQKGPINAPTVFNAVFNHVQFWNGRAASLAEQAAGPPLNPLEMGSESFDEIVDRLNADQKFKTQFEKVYPEGFSGGSITDAIAEFEKTLLTPSPFDRYLEGDETAITQQQKRGYLLFKENRCSTCHVGINLGGQSFEPLGLAHDFFKKDMEITNEDLGVFSLSQEERDRYRQKVPGLRNLSATAPYFHRGDVPTITEAVELMLKFQVGRSMSQGDVNDIVSYLKSLDGEYVRNLPPALE